MLDKFKIDGKFAMSALDQRCSFKKQINPKSPDSVTSDEIIYYKKLILEALKPHFSAVLLDVDYGLKALEDKSVTYLLAAEETGYEETSSHGRITTIQYPPARLKELGASAVKLLLFFNPNSETAQTQIETAKELIKQTHDAGLPIFLEPLNYGGEFNVVNLIKTLIDNNVLPDVYKVQYPGSTNLCDEITHMLQNIPWILLTYGVKYEEFHKQVQTASKHGCSGFLAGRSIWQELLSIKEVDQQIKFLKDFVVPRFLSVKNLLY